MRTIFEALNEMICAGDLTVAEAIDLPARVERRLPIPEAFTKGRIGAWLKSGPGANGTLWRHQLWPWVCRRGP